MAALGLSPPTLTATFIDVDKSEGSHYLEIQDSSPEQALHKLADGGPVGLLWARYPLRRCKIELN